MAKTLLGWISIGLTLWAFIPYIRSILANKIKPHFISWTIWAVSTLVVFVAQFLNGGGAGAWSIGVSGMITLGIAGLAYGNRSDFSITTLDKACLVVAIAAIPLWVGMKTPLYSVILLTTIDMIGFIPTFRKAYFRPFEEQVALYLIVMLRNGVSILALTQYTVVTVLFPALTGIGSLAVVGVILLRRKRGSDFSFW
jgi:hypothetical protein